MGREIAADVIGSHLTLGRHHERAARLAGQQGMGVRMARGRFPHGIAGGADPARVGTMTRSASARCIVFSSHILGHDVRPAVLAPEHPIRIRVAREGLACAVELE